MSYDVIAVPRAARQSPGGVPSLAASIGQAEGGSVQSQHDTAVAFWQAALALEGADALTDGERAVAQAEVDRHASELAPPLMGPQRTAAV